MAINLHPEPLFKALKFLVIPGAYTMVADAVETHIDLVAEKRVNKILRQMVYNVAAEGSDTPPTEEEVTELMRMFRENDFPQDVPPAPGDPHVVRVKRTSAKRKRRR